VLKNIFYIRGQGTVSYANEFSYLYLGPYIHYPFFIPLLFLGLFYHATLVTILLLIVWSVYKSVLLKSFVCVVNSSLGQYFGSLVLLCQVVKKSI